MRHYNIPLFIPHEGCPHDCTFCNQKKITGITSSLKPRQVKEEIKEYLSYFPDGKKTVEVAFFGGSFTGLPLSLQEEFYQATTEFSKEIAGIRLSTRPDYINPEVLCLAKEYGVTMIELGAQSAFDDVLKKNQRGHMFLNTISAVKQIREAGIGVGLQMMTGMFGSTKEQDLQTAMALRDLKPDCIRIYPTLVLRDTALQKLYENGEYCPQTIEEAVESAKEILLLFQEKEIPVIRLGLHAGEDLQSSGTIVAGPFHPAFGELVESRIWRDKLEKEIKKGMTSVTVSSKEVSKAVGHKRENLLYFQEKYGISLQVRTKEEV